MSVCVCLFVFPCLFVCLFLFVCVCVLVCLFVCNFLRSIHWLAVRRGGHIRGIILPEAFSFYVFSSQLTILKTVKTLQTVKFANTFLAEHGFCPSPQNVYHKSDKCYMISLHVVSFDSSSLSHGALL